MGRERQARVGNENFPALLTANFWHPNSFRSNPIDASSHAITQPLQILAADRFQTCSRPPNKVVSAASRTPTRFRPAGARTHLGKLPEVRVGQFQKRVELLSKSVIFSEEAPGGLGLRLGKPSESPKISAGMICVPVTSSPSASPLPGTFVFFRCSLG